MATATLSFPAGSLKSAKARHRLLSELPLTLGADPDRPVHRPQLFCTLQAHWHRAASSSLPPTARRSRSCVSTSGCAEADLARPTPALARRSAGDGPGHALIHQICDVSEAKSADVDKAVKAAQHAYDTVWYVLATLAAR